MRLSLIEAVAERDVHVREMLALKRVADRHGIVNPRVETNLVGWTEDWLRKNPRQAALLSSRELMK
jgi:hypothetical protein